MGEESTSCVYIGSYEDGKIVYEPLAMNVAVSMDLGEEESVDISSPLPSIQAMMGEPITISARLCRKGLRKFYKVLGVPTYLRTEFLFPKKKRRGTARRKRRMKRAEQSFINFIKAKYSGDDFFIPDDAVPPVDVESKRTSICKYVISKDELPAFAGPFEGEEDV